MSRAPLRHRQGRRGVLEEPVPRGHHRRAGASSTRVMQASATASTRQPADGREPGARARDLARGPGRLRAAQPAARRGGPAARVSWRRRSRRSTCRRGARRSAWTEDEHPRPTTSLEDAGEAEAAARPGDDDYRRATPRGSTTARARCCWPRRPRWRATASSRSSASTEWRARAYRPASWVSGRCPRSGSSSSASAWRWQTWTCSRSTRRSRRRCWRAHARSAFRDDAEFVNPNGGAIAFGHPLGASGARLCLTAALELHRRGGRRAIVSLCVGVGQGLALLLEKAG